MPILPTSSHSVIAALAAAFLCVTYWRITLRVFLIVVIALAVFGIIAGIHGATSLMAQHHR